MELIIVAIVIILITYIISVIVHCRNVKKHKNNIKHDNKVLERLEGIRNDDYSPRIVTTKIDVIPPNTPYNPAYHGIGYTSEIVYLNNECELNDDDDDDVNETEVEVEDNTNNDDNSDDSCIEEGPNTLEVPEVVNTRPSTVTDSYNSDDYASDSDCSGCSDGGSYESSHDSGGYSSSDYSDSSSSSSYDSGCDSSGCDCGCMCD